VLKAFHGISKAKKTIGDALILILWPIAPFLDRVPTTQQKMFNDLRAACRVLASNLLGRMQAEDKNERSIMALLGNSCSASVHRLSETYFVQSKRSKQNEGLLLRRKSSHLKSVRWSLVGMKPPLVCHNYSLTHPF
jgi:hypothetical protein